ncbi:MAG: di-trans,poly-cis-decaprenylcistransferase [Gemmatimonadaceae bacterium]
MKRATHTSPAHAGIHVGIIMDGNGRWAAARGLPRTAGHRAGLRTARRIVEEATRAGVGTLTLYAFSADNWSRPTPEVSALMRLFGRALVTESKRCLNNGVRLTIVGRRDRLPASLVRTIDEVEALTAHGRNLHLRVAMDYSARESIMRAAAIAPAEGVSREGFAKLLATVDHDPFPARDVDLLIRSGGEQRLSDFLLWECAYAEFYFASRMWPDFSQEEFAAALADFAGRDRRFGGVLSA